MNIALLSAADKAQLDQLLAPELAKLVQLARLPNNWKPRFYQQKVWDYLVNGGERACLIWHRRSGKDDVALHWACIAAHRRVGEYWHMLPEASQARKAVWDAVNPHTGKRRIHEAFPADLIASINESEMKIRFKNGSLWRVVGSDNYDSLLGSSPCGIVYSEWALADPNARAFLRPILAENKGWELFITTPRGKNHAYKTYETFRQDPEVFSQILTADDTHVFTKERLDKELKDYQGDYGGEEGKSLFEQEYYSSFEAALVGSYYGAYLSKMRKESRICSVPIDRASLVHTAWDLGRSDSTAIWFIQCIGKEIHIVDYHEASGPGLDEYARLLEDKRRQYGWVYGFHYFPHDMNIHEWGNKMSRVQTAKSLGIRPIVNPQVHDMDGVNAVRRLLDITWIDEKKCERGLDALSNFRREWDDRLKMFRDKYLHDWSSHGAKALESFAIGYRPSRERTKVAITLPKSSSFGSVLHERGTEWMSR